MPENIKLGYTEYITSAEEAHLVKNIILKKLKQGKTVNLFCSFSYFTSNYTGIFLINELSNLIKQGCTLYLVMWDINCKAHPRFKRIINHSHRTADSLIEEKMSEVRGLFTGNDIPKNSLHLYRASDVLNRFIRKQNYFIQFYGVTEQINVNDLAHYHKGSHLIQMPLDVFFANFFHELFPEDISTPIEMALIYGYQEKFFKQVRSIMRKQELIEHENPHFLILPPHPYMMHDHAVPEWTMSKDAIVDHMLRYKPDKGQIEQMNNTVLSKVLEEFEIVGKNDQVKKHKHKEFTKHNKKLTLSDQQVALGYNLYNYLQTAKKKHKKTSRPRVIKPKSQKEAILYAKLLSREPIVKILQAIDGEKNMSTLSKELKIQPSNMSNYLAMLKKHEMIEQNDEGKFTRTFSAIKTNFEVGIR